MDYPDYAFRRRHHVLVILWALLFAKCFILEYCVAIYDVPVDSVLYVWSLSLFMATAATLVYVNLTKEEQGGLKIHSRSGAVWIGCLALALIVALSSLAFGVVDPVRLPGIAAVIFAFGYGYQYLYRREAPALCCAAGWCLAIGLLFGIEAPLPLLVFGVWLIAFSAFPSFLIYLRLKNEPKA